MRHVFRPRKDEHPRALLDFALTIGR
jgi:hypothetical protein